MNAQDLVRQCATPAEALMALAVQIDKLNERLDAMDLVQQVTEFGWQSPIEWSADLLKMHDEPAGPAARIEQTGEEETTVVLASVSEEKFHARYDFAVGQLKLHEALPEVEDVCDAYAKGGPLWLWYGNRELLMQYPTHVRRRMVEDVLEDDPATAEIFGRDVLKDPGAEGVGEYRERRGDL